MIGDVGSLGSRGGYELTHATARGSDGRVAAYLTGTLLIVPSDLSETTMVSLSTDHLFWAGAALWSASRNIRTNPVVTLRRFNELGALLDTFTPSLDLGDLIDGAVFSACGNLILGLRNLGSYAIEEAPIVVTPLPQ